MFSNLDRKIKKSLSRISFVTANPEDFSPDLLKFQAIDEGIKDRWNSDERHGHEIAESIYTIARTIATVHVVK